VAGGQLAREAAAKADGRALRPAAPAGAATA
jgi:hypothetical protein